MAELLNSCPAIASRLPVDLPNVRVLPFESGQATIFRVLADHPPWLEAS